MKTFYPLLAMALVIIFAGVATAQPLTIQNMIGDNDGYGFGIADGADAPATLFDNRSAAEMAATDGAQATDLADNFDVTFFHTFDVSQFSTITSATFYIDMQGLQQGQFGGTSFLYLDGVQVLDQTLNMGALGSQVLSFDVNVADLADGALDVYWDNWTVYENDQVYMSDYIAIDYTMLEVNGTAIPEPATMVLFGLGMLGAGVYRRFRK